MSEQTAQLDNVFQIRPRTRDLRQHTGSDEVHLSTPTISEAIENVSTQLPISTTELYPLHQENVVLSTAFKLLSEGRYFLDNSLKMLTEGNLLGSDDAVQQLQAMLPELFCCRSIGDGFGVIVNSIFHSLKNLNGTPLNKRQLEIIRQIISRLYTEIYISFDEAVEEIMSLEEVDLDVEPSYLKYVAEILND